MSRVFLSYAGADTARARWVADQVELLGHEVFFAPASIDKGGDFQQQLALAVADADWFLALASADAAHSDWVRREVQWAGERERAGGLRFLPLRVEAGAVLPGLEARQHLDCVRSPDRAALELRRLLGRGQRKPPPPEIRARFEALPPQRCGPPERQGWIVVFYIGRAPSAIQRCVWHLDHETVKPEDRFVVCDLTNQGPEFTRRPKCLFGTVDVRAVLWPAERFKPGIALASSLDLALASHYDGMGDALLTEAIAAIANA